MARMAGKQKRRNYGKKPNMRKPKVSQNLKKAIKQVVSKNVETKTINVPTSSSTTTNTVALVYPSISGLQYLVQDLFKLPQGVQDSTAILSPNRLGDRVRGVGFLMDYYFHLYTSYTLVNTFQIPYVKVRICVWSQSFGSPLLTAPLLYDSNFLVNNTSTLQPLNWNEGYIKDIIMDKSFIIRAGIPLPVPGGPAPYPLQSVFHFKKYIKWDHIIKYVDNNTVSPNSTEKPIFITISAEVDDANTFVPSGVRLLNTTGYTRAWFKDA